MCRLCDEGIPQHHSGRRDFLKTSAATGAAAGLGLFAARPAAADDGDPPEDHGRRGRRYIIRDGHVMTMDPALGNQGNFAKADVLIEGKKILEVGPNIHAPGAGKIDARGRIVMPGFIDTHHHQFETALRSFLADGLLFNDGQSHGAINYFQYILGTFAPVYRPQDVYINELFGSLSQLDAGVTTCHDISQIHHTPQHSDAAIKGSADSGRRIAFGYFESASIDLLGLPGNQYPQDAARIKKQFFSSDDQLMTMTMGGEIYLQPQPDVYSQSWKLGRQLGLQVVAHIVGSFGMGSEFDKIAQGKGGVDQDIGFGPDNLFIHMTGMSAMSWQAVKDAGAHVSLAVPIEMNMRHGMPPILKTLATGIEPSLSVDVEVTLTADMFTQMRTTMALQRAFINQMALDSGNPAGLPELLTTRDVLRFATMQGAKDLRLDHKVGSLTPGKEADIIILDADAINVTPLNVVPGAVVSLMDRTNVETVIVAGKVRKWKGKLLGVNLRRLRNQLEDSRDFLFSAAGVSQDLFRPN
jgi:cytosine/adenosine deaminase-related metal-dependent hydrolase